MTRSPSVTHATGMTGWSFAIDRGGTFTDVVARSPEGEVVVVGPEGGLTDDELVVERAAS